MMLKRTSQGAIFGFTFRDSIHVREAINRKNLIFFKTNLLDVAFRKKPGKPKKPGKKRIKIGV